MDYKIGINVLEVPGTATPPLVSASTSVAGFVIVAERGPVNEPVRVNSWQEFQNIFGGFFKDYVGVYAIKGFFDNGGHEAWILRAKATGDATAAYEVKELKEKTPIGKITAANPGEWAKSIKATLSQTNNKRGEDSLYKLEIKLNSNIVESYEDLTLGEIKDKVNQTSWFIKIEELKAPGEYALAGGKDGTPDFSKMDEVFAMFDNVSIQMLACPDNPAIITEGITYCANRNDCIYLAGLPKDKKGVADAKEKVQSVRGWDRTQSYAALYSPWILVSDPLNPHKPKEIPPIGHVMGIYARMSLERGIWKAPAGDEAGVRGALGLTHQYSDAEHTQMVREANVNCLRFIPGSGIVVDSSRTLCTDPRWMYVNVRRLFNYVKTSLKDGLRWVRQEPNRDSLWKKVKYNAVTPFLMDLWQQGAFGAGKPSDVFTVKCDADNNPPHLVNQGIFTLEVYFYPSRPAETIVIKVGQQDFGSTAKD